MERIRALVIFRRHQPSPLWRLLRIPRCRYCRRRWPCGPYDQARTALLGHDREDIGAIIRAQARRCTT
ncbi:hypothetical protein ACWDV4_03715 [Micromonospora sp. NPDC003197]